jgi:hypothetical protein
MADPYWVCGSCGHFWASPERPHHCENCDDELNLTECADLEAAEEESQVIIDLINEEANRIG